MFKILTNNDNFKFPVQNYSCRERIYLFGTDFRYRSSSYRFRTVIYLRQQIVSDFDFCARVCEKPASLSWRLAFCWSCLATSPVRIQKNGGNKFSWSLVLSVSCQTIKHTNGGASRRISDTNVLKIFAACPENFAFTCLWMDREEGLPTLSTR